MMSHKWAPYTISLVSEQAKYGKVTRKIRYSWCFVKVVGYQREKPKWSEQNGMEVLPLVVA